ncbi:MAG TPA: MAPEG family protein [Steroidobacteraceae bacterium]|nr:MAPEG family protein [Steroidobacteraceae bacterium]
MRIELYAACLSVILGLVHIILASHSASLQRGYKWTASARDQPVAPLTGVAGRLERALDNFLETFPFFVAMVAVVHFTDAYGELSGLGALLYLAGRVIYLPLYAFGVFLARSLAWNVATAGIVLLLASALLHPA